MKTKAVWGGILTAAALVLMSGQAYAQAVDTKTVTVSATVNAKAKLTLGSNTATFNDADPDVTPLLTATAAISVDVKTRTAAANTVSLTVQADGALTNAASDTIAINQLTWTATGTGFAAGTMSSGTAQSLGSFAGGGNASGTQTYQLVNSWAYKTGTYTAIITYTLTAP